MNPLGLLGKIVTNNLSGPLLQGAGQAIGATAQAIGNDMWKPQTNPSIINPAMPKTPVTQELAPWLKSPIPDALTAPYAPQPSNYERFGQDVQNAWHNLQANSHVGEWVKLLTQPADAQQMPTPTPQMPLKVYPGENEWAQHMMQVAPQGNLNQYKADYAQAVTGPGWSGHYYGQQGAVPMQATPMQVAASQTPTQAAVPNPNIQPNITIPYSQGGQYTLPANLAQPILNAFNDLGVATQAAQLLNHPADNPYLPGDPASVNHITYGENASFKPVLDTTNSDGSVDRGLFRINNNSFNGIMKDPFWGKVAKEKFGINNWNDMNDVQKNADMARLIYERQGWRAWFAAPKAMRAQGAPNLEQLQNKIQQAALQHAHQRFGKK